MTNPNRTDVIYVLDESGSMVRQAEEVRTTLTQQLEENRQLPGEVYVSLTTFHTEVKVHYTAVPAAEVPEVQYRPGGYTALNDALAKTINDAGARFAALPEEERPHRVLVFVMTDGHENSSKEFTVQAVRDLVDHQRDKYSWEFIFLGEGLDIQVGHDLGVRYSISPQVLSGSMARNSEVLRRYVEKGELNKGFVKSAYKGT